MQLVGRKADKVRRRDPWHLVECGGSVWCMACGVWEVVEGRRKQGAESEEAVWVDGEGKAIGGDEVEGVLNWMVWKIGVVGRGEKLLTGKSCRVGGALALARAGVAEQVIRIVGGWSSEALERYVSGVMAAAVGVGEVMRRSNEGEVAWVKEERGRARLGHWSEE